MKKRYVVYLLLGSFLLLMTDIFLYLEYRISFRGYYSDCLVFWVFIFSVFASIFTYWKKIVAKITFILVIIGIIFSMQPKGLPFLLVLNYTTGLGFGFQKMITPHYRFQKVNYGLLRDATKANILEITYFFFEKEWKDEKERILYLEDVYFLKEDKDSLYLKAFYKEGETILEDEKPLSFKKDFPKYRIEN